MATLETAKKLINEFCLHEYEHEADFSNPREVNIAYTEYEEEGICVQVSVDLIGLRFKFDYWDGENRRGTYHYEWFKDLDDLCEMLECMEFDLLVSLPDYLDVRSDD